MNHRERLIAALSHRQPDQVPIDIGGTVNSSIVMEVKRTVEQCIEDMGEGGGYILGSAHNLQPDVPLENMLAMFEHARVYVPSFAR
jgi:uroporphyrinogen-III decarboxylase